MYSLAQDHQAWMSDYLQSDLHGCASGNNSCGLYHLLAPILHDIGLTSSYGSYQDVIRKTLSSFLSENEKASILVAGIESESSASTLLQALDLFRGHYHVTFLDCCPTPLLRLNHCLEEHERQFVRTLLIDLLESTVSILHRQFDIIFADSFIKQFLRPKKIDALRILADLAKNTSSRIVIREYFGSLDVLLPPLWKKLDIILAGERECDALSALGDSARFRSMIPELDEYYKNTGDIYSRLGELKEDMFMSDLRIVDEYAKKGAADGIVVGKRIGGKIEEKLG